VIASNNSPYAGVVPGGRAEPPVTPAG